MTKRSSRPETPDCPRQFPDFMPDTREVTEIDAYHLQPSWDAGCGRSNFENRGTAFFMEPSDTASVIPWFAESSGDSGFILF